MSKLTIYRASAGSGKTFTLTGEYLKILFSAPQNYHRILAVTFTNKATDEMKRRIISELYLLSKGESSKYLNDLKKASNKSDELIYAEAKRILGYILHDYSRFSVQTIDRFFQGIIQAFIREIGIQSGFSLELDNSTVLTEVVDRLLYDLDKKKDLKNWLVRFAENRIEEGKSWNFKKDILSLADELFKENFKVNRDEIIASLANKQFLDEYLNEIKEFKSHFENHLADIGHKAMNLWGQRGLDIEDFKGKNRGVAGHFIKLANRGKLEPTTTARKGMDNEEEWYAAKSDKRTLIAELFYASLNDLLKEAVLFYDDNLTSYNTAEVILRNIYSLGLLTDISLYVSEYTKEKNIFLISSAAEFIFSIIKENDTPFIYEKTGNYFDHFMIDEFQDTSLLQWQNFYPLIDNSLSSHHSNLIVGDVKQSIYRWRNSDWNILDNQLEKQFLGEQLKIENLQQNWRSAKELVNFNNAFFVSTSVFIQNMLNEEITASPNSEQLQQVFGNRISKAYGGLEQQIPDDNAEKKGRVQITFVDNSEEEYREKILEKLLDSVQELQDKKYSLNDIAILVRTGREGKEVADYFVEHAQERDEKYKFTIISNDSLFIVSSISVRLILAVFKFLNDPKDKINISLLVYTYRLYILNTDSDELHELFALDDTENEFLRSFLPKEFFEKIDCLKKLTIYQLTEEIIALFKLGEDSQHFPYLQSFQDVVLRYANDRPADLFSFLNWWENTGSKETLSLDEEQDAIRILTIHKSKGLEFKAVFIPFCFWNMDHAAHNTNFLWCEPEVPPFNKLKKVPVVYSPTLAKTHFNVNYFYEKTQTYVDNLNLLYVAFTRASAYLNVFCPVKTDEKVSKIRTVADLTKQILTNTSDFSNSVDKENDVYQIGEIPQDLSEKQKGESKNLVFYQSTTLLDRFRFALHSDEYFNFNSADESKLDYGKMMHQLFQKIETMDDVDNALDTMVFEGKILNEEKQILKEKIENVIKDSVVKSWFDPEWQIINERDILLNSRGVYRPDRVMVKDGSAVVIDYKFGELENKKYEFQVKNYKDLISNMGYKKVDGYVWYVNLGKVVEVEDGNEQLKLF